MNVVHEAQRRGYLISLHEAVVDFVRQTLSPSNAVRNAAFHRTSPAMLKVLNERHKIGHILVVPLARADSCLNIAFRQQRFVSQKLVELLVKGVSLLTATTPT